MNKDKDSTKRGQHHRKLSVFAVGAVVSTTLALTGTTAASASAVPRQDTLIVGQFRVPTGYIGNIYVAASDAFASDGINQLVYEPLFFLNPISGKDEPW